MSRNLVALSLTAALSAGTALADVPSVAVDIAPVHSLVARVMEGVGEPSLIVQNGASPHGYSLSPSNAKAIQDATLVFWLGERLEPWLEGSLETLAEDADVTTLVEADGVQLLPSREDALFEKHDHSDHEGEEHAEGHDHDHDDHAEGEDHEDHEDHDDHDHDEHDDHDDHDHDEHAHEGEAYDPHTWLSPDNAAVWLNVIAAKLSAADPENAGTYFANAAAAREDLTAVKAEIASKLEPLEGLRFIVFHDAYQYFEDTFDFPASGAISIGDASDPSPARIAEIQGRVAEEGIQCVLSEPQFSQGVVETVMEGTDATTAVIDPLGSDLDLGPAMYPQLLRNMADSLADCLS